MANNHHAILTPPSGLVKATIAIPASKSFSNRALIAAALANGRSIVQRASPSQDTVSLAESLAALGWGIETAPDGTIVVDGGIHRLQATSRTLDVGPAGTAMRFLAALLALTPSGETLLKGSERMHERPIGDLVDTLRELGADVSYAGRAGCPPLLIKGKVLPGGESSIPGTTSSQFISALLLAAPCLSDGLRLTVRGELVSASYIGTTFDVMERFGVSPMQSPGEHRYQIPAGSCYIPTSYQPEGDATGATYWWGIAALSGGTVTVHNISHSSHQGDVDFLRILESMGCTITHGDQEGIPWVTVTGPQELRATTADMSLLPDSAQTLAVVAACARGTTTLRGLETLSHKESDRISDTIRELHSLGIQASGTPSSMTITGGTPVCSRPIETYHDHRMAMSFAMLSAKIPGLVICDPRVTAKSYPHFWEDLMAAGVGVSIDACLS